MNTDAPVDRRTDGRTDEQTYRQTKGRNLHEKYFVVVIIYVKFHYDRTST